MSDQKDTYDFTIAPLIKELAFKCKINNMSFISVVKYEKNGFVKTKSNVTNHHLVFDLIDILQSCVVGEGVNIDAFFENIALRHESYQSVVLTLINEYKHHDVEFVKEYLRLKDENRYLKTTLQNARNQRTVM